MALPFMRALYGPINTWTVPFQDEWLELPAPGEGVKREFWGVNAEERAALDRVGYINMALKELKWHRGQPWRDLAEYTGFAAIADRALMTGARECRLKHPDDLIAFASHALIHGERFYRHPRIQRLLGQTRKGGYAGAAITMLSKQEWAAIAAATEPTENYWNPQPRSLGHEM
jgi:hypothetical protein